MDLLTLISLPGGAEWLIIIGFMFLPAILWIWALIDCLKSNFSSDNKLIWILVIIFLPLIGSIVYLAVGRGQKLQH